MVRTELRFGSVRERVATAAVGGALVVAVAVAAPAGTTAEPRIAVNLAGESGLRCRSARTGSSAVLVCAARADTALRGRGRLGPVAARLARRAASADRSWLARARPLGPGAPAWARRMYRARC